MHDSAILRFFGKVNYDSRSERSYYHSSFDRFFPYYIGSRPLSAVHYDVLGAKMVGVENRPDNFSVRSGTHRQFGGAGPDRGCDGVSSQQVGDSGIGPW